MMDGETLKIIIIADGVNLNLIMMDGPITMGATMVGVIAITKEITMDGEMIGDHYLCSWLFLIC